MQPTDAEALAFAGALSQAERALDGQKSSRATWLRAYLACARGDIDTALAIAAPLAATEEDLRVRVRASLTLASALRQAGRHREATDHDRRALDLAFGADERAHALIGLAADAVGLGDPEACAARLDEAERAGATDPRAAIRLAWVHAEHALLEGRSDDAVRRARGALEAARGAGLRRHVAKSLLFLGAALEADDDAAATETLAEAQSIAAAIGARAIAAAAAALRARAAVRRVP